MKIVLRIGIALAIVEAFVAGGMQVVMADVDEHRVGAEATGLGDEGADVHAVTVDVRDPDAVDRLGRAAVERFGRLNVAVNNAGIVTIGTSWELPLDDWHRVIDVDLWG